MFSYKTLTTQQYIDAVTEVISKVEDSISNAKNIGDDKATIGYGYTFNRDDNFIIWQAANITLTSTDWEVLKKIDNAAPDKKTAIALAQFSKTLTIEEAKALLEHTYQRYESQAIKLDAPESWERVALVSLSYNGAIWGGFKWFKFGNSG